MMAVIETRIDKDPRYHSPYICHWFSCYDVTKGIAKLILECGLLGMVRNSLILKAHGQL